LGESKENKLLLADQSITRTVPRHFLMSFRDWGLACGNRSRTSLHMKLETDLLPCCLRMFPVIIKNQDGEMLHSLREVHCLI